MAFCISDFSNPVLANNVSREDKARALTIIKDFNEKYDDIHKKWCPKCESESIKTNEVSGLLKVRSVLTLGAATMVLSQDFTCNDCGNKWR